MFNRNRNKYRVSSHGFWSSMPVGFRIWFLFVLTCVLSIFALVGYTAYSIASNPEAHAREMGRLIGEAVSGYEEAANQ